MSNLPLPAIFLALIAVNVACFALFWFDKRAAIAGRRRVPEAKLLCYALIGGTPGAFFARHVFRHKTRKQPFSFNLWFIAALQAGAGIGWFIL